jgi:hypothetical protein
MEGSQDLEVSANHAAAFGEVLDPGLLAMLAQQRQVKGTASLPPREPPQRAITGDESEFCASESDDVQILNKRGASGGEPEGEPAKKRLAVIPRYFERSTMVNGVKYVGPQELCVAEAAKPKLSCPYCAPVRHFDSTNGLKHHKRQTHAREYALEQE